MKQHHLIFANFVCHFGGSNVLLDYAEEVVIPAFTNDTFVRTYGNSDYHLYEVELINLATAEEPVLALAGRFIKNTTLVREQTFGKKEGLVKDELSISSAPSAFFVLLLNNHRLIYFPETTHAPSLETFKQTTQNFLRKRHKIYIDEVYEKRKASQDKITKKQLFKDIPLPTVEVLALTGFASIEVFLERFKILKSIDFRLIKPNDDLDAGEILGEIRNLGASLGADRAKLTVANSDGLDKKAATEAIVSASSDGNQEVKLSGIDQQDNLLSGDNESFVLSSHLENPAEDRGSLIAQLFSVYQDLRGRRALKTPPLVVNAKIKRIARILE
ncbi:hypothetical protein ATU3B_24545 [Agrobacterium genomosp. 3 str. CIP 111-78]|uniref:Uncharacterized protein n=1 Tax=Agrobacterium tumefaciens TaxID=358 RepID=A0AAE6EKA6_AGRTU|nr:MULTISPECIES: hypothetical protein [Agrobacterium tumefaciens complex]MCA2374800.1 hypothetical protein [Agrobacterium tomkonis CIP 111-78]QCM00214.1 hypothetical protein CFBP6624_08720 [Agrobacterium tumefaciens]